MTAMTDYTEVAVLNAICNNTSFAVAQLYVDLHTTDPGESAATGALTDSGHARKSVSFGAPTSGAGTCANDAEVTFNAIADAGPFVVTHFSLWDALTAGNPIAKGELATSKTFTAADVPRFPIGSLVLTAA